MSDDDKVFFPSVFIAALILGLLEVLFGSVGAQPVSPHDTARARAIVQRHIDAAGGEAVLRTKPTHMVMTMYMPGSAAVIRMESWQDAPRFYTRLETPGVGTTEMGSDGTTAWMISPQLGAMLLGDQPKELTVPGDVAAQLRTLPMKYVGVREILGKKYEAVVFTVHDTLASTAYFDPASGLMAGMTPDKPPGPPGQMAMSFDDWKRFGAQWYATRMTTRLADGKEIVTRVESVSNEPIDPARFELPDKVRALQARKQ